METYRDVLEHHGIKGMRWGIRRYRNEDGSLTVAGRRKYGSDDYQKVQRLSKKKTKELSNDELRQIAERKELEKKVKGGNEEVNRILLESGLKTLRTAMVVGAAAVGGKYVMNHLPEISGKIAKTVAQSTVNASKETLKVGGEAAKDAAKSLAKAADNVGAKVASTKGARAYVNAVDSARAKVSQGGRAYVNAIDAAREKGTKGGIAYVRAVDKLLKRKR